MSDSSKYKYIKEQSILYGLEDDYSLTIEEYSYIYSFFVTYAILNETCWKSREFTAYGWESNNIEVINDGRKSRTDLGVTLYGAIDLSNSRYAFVDNNGNLRDEFNSHNLETTINDFDTERGVVYSAKKTNKFIRFFPMLRNVLAHGKYILKYSSTNERMVIMQDNDSRRNVTGRMILKLSTLFGIIRAVDRNGLIMPREKEAENLVA